MDKLKIFKEHALNLLEDNIGENINFYNQDDDWVKGFFEKSSWVIDSKLADLPDDLLLIPTGKTGKDLLDYENSQRVYLALNGLSLSQASDPRLWTYLTHVKYWKFMRARWPIEQSQEDDEDLDPDQNKKKSPLGSIKSRYFVMGDKSRALTRNGIARLWWAGYTCHNEHTKKESEFNYMKPLFETQDVFATFMERAFSKNKSIMKTLLKVLYDRYESGNAITDRLKYRSLAKYLVLFGGVAIIDSLDELNLTSLIENHISDIEKTGNML
jgi:hypothetical protein